MQDAIDAPSASEAPPAAAAPATTSSTSSVPPPASEPAPTQQHAPVNGQASQAAGAQPNGLHPEQHATPSDADAVGALAAAVSGLRCLQASWLHQIESQPAESWY